MSAEQLDAVRKRGIELADGDARRLRAGMVRRRLAGRTVLLVDDGIGSGDGMRAAARTARGQGAARIVAAVPVAGPAALSRLGEELDDVVCVEVASEQRWYGAVSEVTDADVAAALRAPMPRLGSEFFVPEGSRGLVMLVGGGEAVVQRFREMRFATFSLPDTTSERDAIGALERLRALPAVRLLRIGCFGLGPGAATVLLVATRPDVDAVVVAGEVPDRGAAQTSAATLFVVGGEDQHGARIVRDRGVRQVAGECQIAVIAGAGRSFAELGAMEQVALLAGGWFARHL
jgi:hypothetical protein